MERPILFTGPMVRAILDGRKTQTRRALNVGTEFQPSRTPGYQWTFRGDSRGRARSGTWQDFRTNDLLALCPCGRVGDRLWVRETWQAFEPETRKFGGGGVLGSAKMRCYSYPAVQGHSVIDYAADAGPNCATSWRPSTHMPRWASRITLEITGVRVERLNAISEADAMAEGDPVQGLIGSENTHKNWFRNLWQDTYGPESWEANPWVWVIEFNKAGA